MATTKAYTNIEQSKKLAEILPLESADMHYHYDYDFDELESIPTITEEDDHFTLFPNDVRCWSLAALLNLMPNFNIFKRTIECRIETLNHFIDRAFTPIDAAFEMICWLKKNHEI